MERERPWIAADSIVFDDQGRVLLVRRKFPPHEGHFALPGGFVEIGETTDAAALRELKEETGIEGASPRLIGVYSEPGRDPRHHVIGIAYLVVAKSCDIQAGDDAADAQFVADWQREPLAFDHHKIISDALALKTRIDRGEGRAQSSVC